MCMQWGRHGKLAASGLIYRERVSFALSSKLSIYAYVYIHPSIHLIYRSVYPSLFISIYLSIYLYLCVCVCVCIYIYIYIYICIYMYIYIYRCYSHKGAALVLFLGRLKKHLWRSGEVVRLVNECVDLGPSLQRSLYRLVQHLKKRHTTKRLGSTLDARSRASVLC